MKPSYFFHRMTVIFACIFLFSTSAMASAVISGTRVIYPSDSKEVSVKITNNGSSPVLLQSWIDNGVQDARPASVRVPFVLTPPLNRVDAGKGQTLRISFTGGAMPLDKESIFWLNVLEVPGKNMKKAVENTLQMAFRSRIKLFYRPAGLKGNANEAPKEVIWSARGNTLEATNPTPYYANFVNLQVNGKHVDGAMVAPKSSLKINLSATAGNRISGGYINDYGAVNDFSATIK
ncbi:molecular chaperone [Enterobacter sp. R1(2018)]|uniref:fimbrial biogenesis chaperone n=1 Tax=Enterobacter sp. R1(2018) TaxID=2447891 RepID=UPI000EB20015|nr:molecular chaperone [Enterobacter sp. R1(2018)]